MGYDRCCMRKCDNNCRYLNKLIISSSVTSIMRHNSFQPELLACPQVLFSSKSLSLPIILGFCKNSVIFPSFAFFLCIISFAMSIMFALFFVGIPSPSIGKTRQTSSKLSIKKEICSLVFVRCGSCLGSNAYNACNLVCSLASAS